MKPLNRNKGPEITEITSVSLPEVYQFTLSNGIPVYEVSGGVQEVIKIELVFQSGRPYEVKKMLSKATSYLLKEGTATKSSADIANEVDFYGATLKTTTNLDDTRIVLYTLKKFFKQVSKVLTDILSHASFPQKELDNYIGNSIQNLNIDLSKDEFKAYRILTENIFGPDHPYGYNSSKELYAGLRRDDVVAHYESTFGVDNCRIYLSGKTDQTVRDILDEACGQFERQSKLNLSIPVVKSGEKLCTILSENAHQTAIRIGRRMFNRQHPDYATMFFLSTLLGGYFGSRLMTNLREDKGYTYSVYAGMDDFVFDGYFYISADVGNDYVNDSIKEIHKELHSLIESPVTEKEIHLVKNYLMGSLLNMLDGPFNQSQVVRTLLSKGMPLQTFDTFVQSIVNISSEKLQEAAKKYIDPETMLTVLVGGVRP